MIIKELSRARFFRPSKGRRRGISSVSREKEHRGRKERYRRFSRRPPPTTLEVRSPRVAHRVVDDVPWPIFLFSRVLYPYRAKSSSNAGTSSRPRSFLHGNIQYASRICTFAREVTVFRYRRYFDEREEIESPLYRIVKILEIVVKIRATVDTFVRRSSIDFYRFWGGECVSIKSSGGFPWREREREKHRINLSLSKEEVRVLAV